MPHCIARSVLSFPHNQTHLLQILLLCSINLQPHPKQPPHCAQVSRLFRFAPSVFSAFALPVPPRPPPFPALLRRKNAVALLRRAAAREKSFSARSLPLTNAVKRGTLYVGFWRTEEAIPC